MQLQDFRLQVYEKNCSIGANHPLFSVICHFRRHDVQRWRAPSSKVLQNFVSKPFHNPVTTQHNPAINSKPWQEVMKLSGGARRGNLFNRFSTVLAL